MFNVRRRPFIAGISFGLAHAVLFGVAFPPIGWWWGVLFAVVPLMVLAARTDRPARSAVGAGLASIPMWAFHHQYVWAMSEAGFFPLMAYLALYPGLFVWMLSRVHARWPRLPLAIAAPIIWTGLEVLRGELVWDGYPLFLVAQPLIDRMIASWAETIGVYGVGLAVTIASVEAASAFSRRVGAAPSGLSVESVIPPEAHASGADAASGTKRRYVVSRICRVLLVIFAIWVLLNAAIPWMLLYTPPGLKHSYSLAAIQTNVPQDNRVSQGFADRLRDFEEFCRLTRDAARGDPKPDLIVWPEGMFPGLALNASAVRVEREAGLRYPDGTPTTVFHDRLIELQEEIGVPMLVGGTAMDGLKIGAAADGTVDVSQDALFNSAFMVRDGVVEELRYDKMHLTPFGEVMPYLSNWEWLEQRLLALGGRGLTFDIEAGERVTCFEIGNMEPDPARSAGPPLRIATPICFEAVYADQMRRLANGGSAPVDVLINMSNEGWFAGFDGARENLVLLCRWRALELRRPILRAVNTGVSVAIDADGRVISRLPARTAGVLTAEFDAVPGRRTIYSGWRDGVGWVCFGGMVVMVAEAVLKRKKPGDEGIRG